MSHLRFSRVLHRILNLFYLFTSDLVVLRQHNILVEVALRHCGIVLSQHRVLEDLSMKLRTRMHGEFIHELCFDELELQLFVLDVLCLLYIC